MQLWEAADPLQLVHDPLQLVKLRNTGLQLRLRECLCLRTE